MNTQETNSNYFVLKGFTSIIIGVFIFCGAYIIKTILDSSTNYNTYKVTLISVPIITFLLSTFALYITGKKSSEKQQQKLWNDKTIAISKKYTLAFLLIFCVLIVLLFKDFYNYLAPIFLIFYGFLLFFVKNKKRKNLFYTAGKPNQS